MGRACTGEGYKNDQANHFSGRATTCTASTRTSRVWASTGRFIFHVHFSGSAFSFSNRKVDLKITSSGSLDLLHS